MDSNTTHLEIHTGLTKEVRTSATPPTSPTPESGDIFVDSTAGSESFGIRNASAWVYVSLL